MRRRLPSLDAWPTHLADFDPDVWAVEDGDILAALRAWSSARVSWLESQGRRVDMVRELRVRRQARRRVLGLGQCERV